MEQDERDKMRRIDHDLLIEVSTNLKNLIIDFKEYKTFNSALDTRVRSVEDVISKLSPIPSVSHQEVINEISSLKTNIIALQTEKNFVLGGWKGAIFIIGATTGIVSFIALVLQLLGYFRQ